VAYFFIFSYHRARRITERNDPKFLPSCRSKKYRKVSVRREDLVSCEVDSFSELLRCQLEVTKKVPTCAHFILYSFFYCVPERSHDFFPHSAAPCDLTTSSVSHATSTTHHMCMHRVSVDSVAHGNLPSLAGVGVVFRPGIY
jgi:hypothetical protein